MNSGPKRFDNSSRVMLSVVVFFAAGYILFPLYALLKESLSSAGHGASLQTYAHLFRSTLPEAAFNSVAISILSVIGSGIAGTFIAYVFHFLDFPAKSFFSKIVLIPLALPPLVGVISFLFLVGESGMLSRILASVFGVAPAFFSVNGWTAIVLVHVYSFYVFFYLFVSAALSRMDGAMLDASASLGAARGRTIRTILLPALTPALVGSSLMTFMSSMASFSAPLLFGGTTRFLTLEIYTAKLNGDNSAAAGLAILLSVISVCLLLFLRWWQDSRIRSTSLKGVPRKANISHGKWTKRILLTLMSVLLILFALPVFTIVLISLVKEGSWTYQIFPDVFSVDNYRRFFSDARLVEPILNSIWMSLLAVIIVILVGVTAAFLIKTERFRGSRLLEIILSLPYGIPGTVIAVGLIVTFNRPTIFSFQSILVGTLWIMPIAYAVRNLPLLYRSAAAGLDALDPSLQEAAETLGSSNGRTVRKIILPVIMPSVISGILLVFINSVGEFVSSILLYSYGTRPVSVEILSQLRLFNIGGASVYGTLLTVLVMFVIALSNRFFRASFTL